MRRLAAVGITTREACGNSVRNVTGCPIAGVCKSEAFDISPYAKALAAYLLVLVAYSIAPLATVAPLRESGIVLAAAWGTLRMGEAAGGREAGSRIAAAGLVVIGAILLAVCFHPPATAGPAEGKGAAPPH